ncbi:MAG: hypothetical protein Q4B58_05090 [Bacteroidales bacterium]|nr:hypothetical protein [Bacteroidales bacterium]
MKRYFNLLFCLLGALCWSPVLASDAVTADIDANAPIGWATCASLSGGTYAVTGGGAQGKSITLQSAGSTDMRSTITKAIKNNDIIVLDGSGTKGTDFIISKNIDLSDLSNKTIVGINGARLCTQWHLTPELIALLDEAGVKDASTTGGGGTLSNGVKISEAAEYLTRKTLLEATGDAKESYRHSGIFTLSGCNNIIIRNLKLVGPGSVDVGGYDLISCNEGTTHLWVDHCDFTDGIDGNFDITHGSDFVSVTWCTFSYTARSYMHQNTNLVGSGDHVTSDEDKLNVTFAYNIWGAGCRARMPMVRYGTVHVFNNYYNCGGNLTACINPRKNSEVLIEGNYFDKEVSRVFSNNDSKGYVWDESNYIGNAKTKKPASTYEVLDMPYIYNVRDAQTIPDVLTSPQGAGATLVSPLTIEETPTGIDPLVATPSSAEAQSSPAYDSYNLQGQPLASHSKGLRVCSSKVIMQK